MTAGKVRSGREPPVGSLFGPSSRRASVQKKRAWTMLTRALPHVSGERTLHFALMPAEDDARTLVQNDRGEQRFRLLLNAAVPLSEFFLQLLAERNRDTSVEGRAALLQEATTLLAGVSDPSLRLLLGQAVEDLARDRLVMLKTTEQHDEWLRHALCIVVDSLIIVSPWITLQGITRTDLGAQIRTAVQRGVGVTIFTDIDFNLARRKNSPHGDLLADGAFDQLTGAGGLSCSSNKFIARLSSVTTRCWPLDRLTG